MAHGATYWRRNLPEAADLAQEIIDLLSDKQAEDIVLLDISQASSFADFFVIASGQSMRQLNALVQTLDADLNERHPRPRHVEGTAESGWVLLDYRDVIVHLFAPAERAFYNLEGLWSRSVPVVRFQ
ncbi:MAG: ribosome silencing factor [Dehalococcoidia bacterium]